MAISEASVILVSEIFNSFNPVQFSRTTVPQLPCLSDVDINNHSQQESNEIATRENLITKERYKQLMFEKDAEIRRLKEELSKYRNLDEAGSSGK
jgi:uncharacterized protein YlaN (UPF0358 family)